LKRRHGQEWKLAFCILEIFVCGSSRHSNESDLKGHNFTRCLYFLAYHIRHTLRVLSFPFTDSREALRYKPEGHGIDSRLCHWNFWLAYSFRPYYVPGVDSASNRNEYHEYFLGIKAAGANRWQP